MHVNVAIHPSWLGRPEELGRRLAALTVLERTAPPGASPATTTSPIRPIGSTSPRKLPTRNGRPRPRAETDGTRGITTTRRGARRPTGGNCSAGPASRSRT